MINLDEHLIQEKSETSHALEKLSALGHDLTLFVIDEDKALRGTLTDGDIRRGLLKGFELKSPVSDFMNRSFRYIKEGSYNLEEIKAYKQKGIVLLPLVNSRMQILKVINLSIQETILPVSAVIMAGGEGQRLRPLTETTPKSLLKVGDKPIVEHIVDKLVLYGVSDVKMCVNYLGDMIIDHFSGNGHEISVIEEKKKLGTAGALSLIEEFDHDTILLMNADLLTNLNFEDFYRRFIESGADLMVACVPYSVNIPYAVLELEDGCVLSLKEKPTYTYYSNAGIYLVKKEHLKTIPDNEKYDATDLIDDMIAANKKLACYPILGFWVDIGSYDDYRKANEYVKHNKI